MSKKLEEEQIRNFKKKGSKQIQFKIQPSSKMSAKYHKNEKNKFFWTINKYKWAN